MTSAWKKRRIFLGIQILTVSRIPTAIIFALIIQSLSPDSLLYVFPFLLLAFLEVSDTMDGFLSRKFGVTSRLGEVLDPYTDSFSRLIVYWGLAQHGLVFFAVPLIMAIRDVTVAYCRIILVSSNESPAARIGGKIKATTQAIGAFAAISGPILFSSPNSWLVPLISYTVMLITLLSASEYMRDALTALKRDYSE